MKKPLFAICALAAALSVAACSNRANSEPTPTPPSAASTAVSSSTPVATAPPTATPLPTVEPPDLKLRLVNVASGANSDLPVGFGRAVAWSPDGSRVAVANEGGVAGGALNAQRFARLWAGDCSGADWSPRQDLIAAACKDGLVILDTGGKVVQRDQGATREWVHWSPNGKSVAYGSFKNVISILGIDGSRATIPGSFASGAASAQWLPGGRLVTVEQPDYRDATTIRVHDPVMDYAVVAKLVTRPNASGLGIDREGKYAAFGVYGPPAGSGVPRILPSTVVVVRIADGQEIATFPAYPGYETIDFSPDGRSVLMQTDYCGPGWSLAVGSLDGSARAVARGSFMVTKFSPDGTQVGFTRGTELWVVASDGNTPARRLAEGVHGPAGFEWSPDGKWISVPPFFGGFDQCP